MLKFGFRSESKEKTPQQDEFDTANGIELFALTWFNAKSEKQTFE